MVRRIAFLIGAIILLFLVLLTVLIAPADAQGPDEEPPVRHEPDFPNPYIDAQAERVCIAVEAARVLDKTYTLLVQMATETDSVGGYEWTVGYIAESNVGILRLLGDPARPLIHEAYVYLPLHAEYWLRMMTAMQALHVDGNPFTPEQATMLDVASDNYQAAQTLYVSVYGCDLISWEDIVPMPEAMEAAEQNIVPDMFDPSADDAPA